MGAWPLLRQTGGHQRKLDPGASASAKALAPDPDLSPLNAMVGLVHIGDARFGWWDDRPTALAKGRRHAEKALSVDPENADAHITAGYADMIEGQWNDAITRIRKAVERALSADAATLASFILACAGQPQKSCCLSKEPFNLVRTIRRIYLEHLGIRRFASPADSLLPSPHVQAVDARTPGFGLADLVIAYQQTNCSELARQTAERFLALRPTFTVAGWVKTQFRRCWALLDAEAAALATAGLPPGAAARSLRSPR